MKDFKKGLNSVIKRRRFTFNYYVIGWWSVVNTKYIFLEIDLLINLLTLPFPSFSFISFFSITSLMLIYKMLHKRININVHKITLYKILTSRIILTWIFNIDRFHGNTMNRRVIHEDPRRSTDQKWPRLILLFNRTITYKPSSDNCLFERRDARTWAVSTEKTRRFYFTLIVSIAWNQNENTSRTSKRVWIHRASLSIIHRLRYSEYSTDICINIDPILILFWITTRQIPIIWN